MNRREFRWRPAISKVSDMMIVSRCCGDGVSAAGEGADDFQLVAGGQAGFGPAAGWDHLSGHHHGNTFGAGGHSLGAKQCFQGECGQRLRLAVHLDLLGHCCSLLGSWRFSAAFFVNRPRPKERMMSAVWPVRMWWDIVSAVTGASRMPLRWWPVASTRP